MFYTGLYLNRSGKCSIGDEPVKSHYFFWIIVEFSFHSSNTRFAKSLHRNRQYLLNRFEEWVYLPGLMRMGCFGHLPQ